MTRRAGIYLRISEDRTGERLGVDRQRTDCLALAERLGWTVTDTFEDNDVSAYGGRRRPAYKAMVDAIESGRVNSVIAWHTDRLHRNTRELQDYVDLSVRRDVLTQTVSAGPVDLSTPAGRATAKTLGAWAQYESEQKGLRQSAAARQAAEAGKPSGGPRPFGYQTGGMSLDPIEAGMVRTASADLLAGVSLGEIVRRWNGSGVTTTLGHRWSNPQVRQVLQRPRNAGLRAYRGEVIGDAQWPPIVDRATLDAVAAMLRDPARRTSPGFATRYLLSGVGLCGVCGERLVSAGTARVRADGSRRAVYRCGTRRHVARDIAPVDELIGAVVVARLQREDALALLQPVDAGPERAARVERATALRTQLDDAAALFADGSITARQLSVISGRLRVELGEVEFQTRQEQSAGALAPLVGADDVAGVWAGLSLGRRRAVVDALMVVRVLPEVSRGARRFDPSLVVVEWRR